MKAYLKNFAIVAALIAAAAIISAQAQTVLFSSRTGDVNFPGLTPSTIDGMAIGNTTRSSVKSTTLDANDQITTSAGLPTIASGDCGASTNGAVVAGSTNQSMSITIGATATATCKITFSKALAIPKACSFSPMNATAAAVGTTVARIGAPTSTDVTITGSALQSSNYNVMCL